MQDWVIELAWLVALHGYQDQCNVWIRNAITVALHIEDLSRKDYREVISLQSSESVLPDVHIPTMLLILITHGQPTCKALYAPHNNILHRTTVCLVLCRMTLTTNLMSLDRLGRSAMAATRGDVITNTRLY
jgi:hypothetical protein